MSKRFLSAVFLFSLAITVLTGCKGKLSAESKFDIPVTLAGGSGKAKLLSPATIIQKNNKQYIRIVFNSSNYDYLIADGKKYLNEAKDGNSTFTILISNSCESFEILANTTAMSKPHEIKYTVVLGSEEISQELLEEEVIENKGKTSKSSIIKAPVPLTKTGDIHFTYANQLEIEKYGNYRLINIFDSGRFFVVPEGEAIPDNLPYDITVLQQPLNRSYMVSTSAMDFAAKLNILDMFKFSSLKENEWFIPEAKQAMKNGTLVYAGKYNIPDYERLYAEKCTLALENTMLLHNPETKEKLQELGIPVLIERSTYEGNPLGRLEWIKLYGTLFNKEAEAQAFYETQLSKIEKVFENQNTEKTVAFFYVTSNGAVNVRKPGDYIAKMIEIAGGKYIPDIFTDSGNSSTANIQMENFYAACLNSDFIIYNGTIDSSVHSLKGLIAKDQLFKNFAAVKSGRAYYVEKRLFQETTGLADFILDLNKVLNGNEESLVYLKRLK